MGWLTMPPDLRSSIPLDIEEADWDFIHSVNLKSVFFCCQAAAKSCSPARADIS